MKIKSTKNCEKLKKERKPTKDALKRDLKYRLG